MSHTDTDRMSALLGALGQCVDDEGAFFAPELTGVAATLETLAQIEAHQHDVACPATAFLSADRDVHLPGLVKWLDERLSLEQRPSTLGLSIGRVSLADPDGRPVDAWGIVATRDLEEGALVCNVPLSLAFVASPSSPSLKALASAEPALMHAAPVLLAVHTALEAVRGDACDHAPYLRSLPRSFSVPLAWTELREWRLLDSTPALAQAASMLRNTAKFYVTTYRALERLPPAERPCPPAHFTWALFRWATCVVMTRQNALPAAGTAMPGRGASGVRPTLVPFFDVFNHAPQAPLRAGLLEETGAVGVHSWCAVRAGEEVTMSYGTRSALDFFLFAGFVAPGIRAQEPVDVLLRDTGGALAAADMEAGVEEEAMRRARRMFVQRTLTIAPVRTAGVVRSSIASGFIESPSQPVYQFRVNLRRTGSAEEHTVVPATLAALACAAVFSKAQIAQGMRDSAATSDPRARAAALWASADTDTRDAASALVQRQLHEQLTGFVRKRDTLREARDDGAAAHLVRVIDVFEKVVTGLGPTLLVE